ncbi:hypothetical protein BP00DRAFT_84558 [Aspergillus indologenus CBS 114.80]|uniref:Uncharacterized protein n=1 Tax=Aspergillus indologenus CBS 114.80 TaxID=1450541 RepID=A0A2V5IYR8_9EURO|nr:hypothetical protein BP00DRAFT_84558 [Aspergillus indologenus CBS 114.80]
MSGFPRNLTGTSRARMTTSYISEVQKGPPTEFMTSLSGPAALARSSWGVWNFPFPCPLPPFFFLFPPREEEEEEERTAERRERGGGGGRVRPNRNLFGFSVLSHSIYGVPSFFYSFSSPCPKYTAGKTGSRYLNTFPFPFPFQCTTTSTSQ